MFCTNYVGWLVSGYCQGIATSLPCSLCSGAVTESKCVAPRLQVHVEIFSLASLAERRGKGAPICWMWGQLAVAAHREFDPDWTLLAGDDVTIEPQDWACRLSGTNGYSLPSCQQRAGSRYAKVLCLHGFQGIIT